MSQEINTLLAIFSSHNLLSILEVVAVVLTLFIIYKLVNSYLSRFCKRLKIEEHIENALRLVARIIIAVAGLGSIMHILGLSTTWLLGGSALVGAVVGFGSTQTIGNIMAGFYVVISKPFTVKDFVKIGDIAGQVEAISINYTEIYTPSRNLLKIPNSQVLNSQVLHCTKQKVIDYTFTVGFGHELSSEELVTKCIQPAIETFYEKYQSRLPEKPKYYLTASDRLGRTFAIRTFFHKGDARTLYTLQPELLSMIIDCWDAYRKAQT